MYVDLHAAELSLNSMYVQNIGVVADAWLKLADTAGIFDDDCLRLAELHSAAVDYPKTGRLVPMGMVQEITERRIKQDPDWYIPEMATGRQRQVYQSQSALGQLFRSIDLADEEDDSMTSSNADSPEIDEEDGITFDEVLIDIRTRPFNHPRLLSAISILVQQYLHDEALDKVTVQQMWDLFVAYVSRLRGLSAKHVISTSRSSLLPEEDIIIGTVSAKCTQTRRREDLVNRVREQTAMLVDSVCFEISGGNYVTLVRLKRAWTAYRMSCILAPWFGGQSFCWIAMGEIFDTVRRMRGEQGHTR